VFTRGDEIRALRELHHLFPESGFVFATERGVLRHGCGYALANAGHDTRAIQDWLGHRSIQHTVRYTELSPARVKKFWSGTGEAI
jgi:site-specific recombinase XerD